MSLSSQDVPARRSGRRWWRTGLAGLAWLLFAAWSLCLLAWLALHWGILPRLDEWRPQVESLASRSLGLTVRIGRITVDSAAWVPALELRDVVLLDADRREALHLPRVAAALSPRSLLSLDLRFEQLLIDGARLEVRRDKAGRIRVAGLELESGGGDAGDHALADWFFSQHEFAIRGGTLRWVDELRGAPPLALADVLLVVRNGLRSHDLRLDATPPADWGERFSLQLKAQQPLWARAGDWMRWSGTVHAQLPRADVAQLRSYVSLPFELDGGAGALRAWVDWADGRPGAATLDFALAGVGMRLAPDLAPLAFDRIAGRLTAQRLSDGARLEATGIRFVAGDGMVWPDSRIALTWRFDPADPAQAGRGGELDADRLDLGLMAQLAERLPLGAGVRRLLAETRPVGTVQGLAVRWDGPLDAPRQYQVRAQFKSVSVAGAPSPETRGVGRPGWRNADVDLQASETGGEARLALANGALELPGVFEQALMPLHRFDARLLWRIEPARVADQQPQVTLQVKEARFANDDAQGEVSAVWRSGQGTGFGKGLRLPGTVEMDGKLAQGRATAVARYLPLGLPEHVRQYLHRAVRAGQVKSATFRVRGDLWDFPFVNRQEGEFRIAGQVQGVELAYLPDAPAEGSEPAWVSPWPAFTQAEGELVFERTAMQIRNARARLWGLELREVNGGIRDLAHQQTLELDGQARGPAADFMRYVQQTPIGGWIGGALSSATIAGAGELKLALAIPLANAERSTVKGSLALAGGDFRMRPDLPLLGGARARVDFTQRGLAIVGGSARALGGELAFEGGTQPDGSLRFVANGQASAEGLRRAAELEPLPQLGAVLRGQAAYRLQLGFVRGFPEIAVTSTLAGMAVDLPAPLAKVAEATLPLRWETQLEPEAPGAPAGRDRLRIELGNVLQAQFQREPGRDAMKVLRGAIGIQAPLPPLSAGVRAVAEFGSVNADAWAAAMALLGGGAAGEGDAASGYQPSSVALRAQELVAGSRRISHVVLGLNRLAGGAEGWRGNLEADQLGGYFEYHEPVRGAAGGRLYARLARLSLPPSEEAAVEQLLDSGATRVPALDIQVDDFELRGRKLGRLEIEAVHRSAADGLREWRLNRLELRNADARLAATGQWQPAAAAARRRTSLDFKLDVGDGGALLRRLGFGELVRGSKGALSGRLSWLGTPLSLDLPTLDGQVHVALEAGQFMKADAGAARLLGVLSLQSLPRRLALDFRDVFQDGFAFDNISGDARIAAGVASTNNLRLRGVQAAALMEGQADIGRETQDLRVIVVPEINAGTASLAYAAIQPAVGLGTFFAQWLLRGPLREANTREFHITGSWDDPKVERVEHKPGTTPDPGAAAAPEAPPSAASAASAPRPATPRSTP